jgi:hypothetical protein
LLILHIGTPKTGSSALQHYLTGNADALLEMGVRYISAGREGTHRSSHRDLVLALLGKTDLSVWQQVRTELAEREDATNVISAEGLWFEDPAKVRMQLPAGELDVQIVVYLRRQDHYLQSLWKQAVLDGRRHNFDVWRERVPFRGNYLTTLDKWACEFGADALLVRPYDRNGKRDTIRDFCELLGLDCAPAAKEVASKNPTPRLEIVQFVRALNQLNLDVGRHQLRQSLVGKNSAYVRSCDVLSYDSAAQLMQNYESENAELGRKYYRDTSSPLFPPLEPYSPPELWDSQLDEYFRLMTDMLRAVTDSMARGQIRQSSTPGKRKKAMSKATVQKA